MDEARYRTVEAALWKSLNVTPTERMVELPSGGSAVRVQEVGQGEPILFVHGGAVNGTSWASLAAELNDYRCLLLDRPGAGLSPVYPTSYSTIHAFNRYAQDLVADVLDGLELDRAHVVGTSLGGYFTFRGAAAHPKRFDRLIGIGSIFGSRMDHIPLVMRIGALGPMPKIMAKMPANRQAVRAMLRQIGLKDALKNGRVTREFEDWFIANIRDTRTLINEIDTNPQIIDMRGLVPEAIIGDDILQSISCPTKLIWGEADPMAGPDAARTFADQIAGCDLELWPATGHAPWMDYPDRAAASIREFLTS